jgi:hypothetical protein
MKKDTNDYLNDDFCFSKVLKDIDAKLKFRSNKQEEIMKLVKQMKKDKRDKQILSIRKMHHDNVILSLRKANEEKKSTYDIYSRNFNNNLIYSNSAKQIVSLSSTIENILSLPKIKNNLTNTNDKLDFKDDRDNEEYNTIRFEKVWNQQYEDRKNRNKDKNKNKIIKNKTMYNNYAIDIFDINYDRQRKRSEEFKESKLRLKRIKLNNLKVKKKLNSYHDMLSKFKDKREYCPNYNCIEKHQPEVKLNTKSQRVFPIQIIKQNIHDYHKNNDSIVNNSSKNKNNRLKKNRSNLSQINNSNHKNYNESDIMGEKNRISLSKMGTWFKGNNSVFKGIKNKNKSVINKI